MNQARQANILVVDDKEINRELLLVEAAHRLTGCVREMDTVARFGGNLIRFYDPEKLRRCERIRT